LPSGRSVTARLFADLMLGAESSDNDWGGWDQFMPMVAHWREGDAVGVLWLEDPRQVWARVEGRSFVLSAERPGGQPRASLLISAPVCAVHDGEIHAGRARVSVAGSVSLVQGDSVADLHRVVLTPVDPDATRLSCRLMFAVDA
jgi:hypothetical protein